MNKQEVAAKLRDALSDAVEKEIQELDPTRFTRDLIGRMEKQRREITLKLIGLENTWDRWEVDHCNGRNGQVAEAIAAQCRPEIEAWLVDTVKKVLATELKDIKGEHKKALRGEIKRHLDIQVRDTARHTAQQITDEIMAELTEEILKQE